MKKTTLNLAILVLFLLSFNPVMIIAQDLGCSAAKMNSNLAIKDFQFVDDVNSLEKDGATWSAEDGYKVDGTCDHDCNIAPFDNAPPSAICNDGAYQVPVKIWIITDDDGSNQSVTSALAAEQIAYANSYHACNGIPIELVEVASSPGFINSTDFNNFNDGTPADATDDADVAAFATVGAVNVYIPKTLNGGGCNGYAYLPGGPDRILMASNCFTSGIDPCVNTSLSVVFIHEFGHYLGLLHTHGDYVPDSPSNGNPYRGTISQELVDGTNGCTTGDFVQDTPADLGINHSAAANTAGNPIGGCATSSGCTSVFVCSDANDDVYTPQLDNIMSYNNLSGCRQVYTDCQKAKMVDALVCSRTNLCGKTTSDFFASNDLALREKNICLGGTIPSFTANDACKSWYAYSGGTRGALLHTGMTFNPGTDGGASNATAATFEYWINDVNEYNTECGQLVKLTIYEPTAAAVPSLINLTGNGTTSLSSPDPNITADQIIGWWVRSGTAVDNTTFADQAALDAGLAAATNGGTVMDNPDNIFGSTIGTPATQFDLTMNCNDLDPAVTYYATPFISNSTAAVADATCNDVYSGMSIVFNGNQGSSMMSISANSISCAPANSTNLPSFTVDVNVTAYGGDPATFSILLTNFDASEIWSGISGNGVDTYTFTQAAFPANFDPNISGFRVFAYDSASGSVNAGVVANAIVNITYPGTPAVGFPDVEFTPCVFGAPVAISCSAALPIELVSFQGEQKGEDIELFWNTVNEQNNDFFTLEKADKNGIFREIALVKGAGTTNEDQYYSETDTRPYVGQNLYRLKQTDFDGKTTISSVISVNFKADETIEFFPNPVKGGVFTLQYQTEKNTGEAQLEIFALNGQKLHAQILAVELGVNRYEIRVNDLAKGVYLARIIKGSSVHTFKLTNVE